MNKFITLRDRYSYILDFLEISIGKKVNKLDEATKDSLIRDTFKIDGDYQSNERIIQEIKDTGFDPEKNPITDILQKRLRNIGDVFKSK